jgi:hypothetical protein
VDALGYLAARGIMFRNATLMNSPRIKIATNVLAELENTINQRQPAFSTERGDRFLSNSLPVAAIRLKIKVQDYLAFLASLPQPGRPELFKVVPVDNMPFEIVIRGVVEVGKDTTVMIDGRPATIL